MDISEFFSNIDGDILWIIFWVLLIGFVVFVIVGGLKNKSKYAGRNMEPDRNWMENSQGYYRDESIKSYYFHPDKSFFTQGHLMEDRSHNVVYEAKILYGDFVRGYETDFINHIINYTSHHNIGSASTHSVGVGNIEANVSSGFKFDGEYVWTYLQSKGYYSNFIPHGFSYTIEVAKEGKLVGTIYSSNMGKNYFNCTGPIEPKMGGKGFCIVECADKDVDALFLYAVAYARTEMSMDNS